MKKPVIIAIVAVLLLAVTLIPLGCASKAGSEATATTQTTTVKLGNLTIDITASGNLALTRTADLAFDIAGTVESVGVEVGDNVTEGQELAKLDTTAWETSITNLERQLTAAQRKVTTTQRAVTTAERALVTAQKNADNTVEAKHLALSQQEITLKNAQIALENAQNTYTGPTIEAAQAAVDRAKAYLQYALDGRVNSTGSATTMWDSVVSRAQADLNSAQATLDQRLTGGDPDDIAIKKKQLEIAQKNYQDAVDAVPQAVEDGKIAVENAKIVVEDAKIAVEDAQTALKDAQKALDEGKKGNPVIKAPFTGFVTAVNVKGGDEVLKGKVAVQVADPNRFEANIMVNEMDILQVKTGGMAFVQPTAMSSVTLPATVTKISPTATISQGVVNYQVTVEVKPLSAATAGQLPSGQTPTGQPRTGQSGTGQSSNRTTTGQAVRPQASGIATDFQLRQGLTVTVSILVQQKQGVLLVPNQTITRQGQNTYVQVMENGAPVQRMVKTGMSNWQSTEITEGLTEGETVIIPRSTGTSSTSSQGNQMRAPVFIPGVR
ncbi:MAG: HlyD family efflux transporter periplasmic adaptor subunit [Dehalococcoidales bacterium]|nr:HlyD family efflux transporter periplasmic adaptor subunit [Dehalococcoidales bacterium]